MRWGGRKSWIALVAVVVLGGAAYLVDRLFLGRNVQTFQAAQNALEQRDFRQASQLLQQCIKAWPDDLGVRLLAAQCARRQGLFDEAAQHRRVVRWKMGMNNALQLEDRLAQLQQGDLSEADDFLMFCNDRSDEPEAPLVLEALIEGMVRGLRIVKNLGLADGGAEVSIYLPKARRAVELWQAQRTARVDQVQGLLWSSRFFSLADDHPQAVAELRKALALDPEHYEARLELASTIVQEAPVESAEHFTQLLQRRPEDLHVRFLLGGLRRSLGQLDSAQKLLDEVLAAKADHVSAIAERGKVALDAGRPVEAEEWLRRAHQLAPDAAQINLSLSQCLRRLGKAVEAQQYHARFEQLEAADRQKNDALIKKMRSGPSSEPGGKQK